MGYCASPENIHTPPQEGLEFPGGWGRGSIKPNNLKKCMKLNWNLQRARGSKKKSLPWGRCGYFLELHILHLWQYRFNLEAINTV